MTNIMRLKNRIKYYLMPKIERERIALLRDSLSGVVQNVQDNIPESSLFWENFKKQLTDFCLRNDPRNFLWADFIRLYFFVDGADYISKELQFIEANKAKWELKYREALTIDCSLPSSQSKFFKDTNDNTIHHLYHITKYESFSNNNIDELEVIVEFGGGYGNMCRLVKKLGFKGIYIIYDGKELNFLQRFYLSYNNINAVILEQKDHVLQPDNVYLVNDMNLFSKLNLKTQKGLLLATWSLSEVSMNTREMFLSTPLISSFSEFLLAYQATFFENDNESFFVKWFSAKNNINWISEPIPHIPNIPSKYIFSTKTNK